MTRSDLRPLPKESETRIERVRARHEVKIRSAFVNWRRETAGSRPLSLTAQQQFELQTQLVAMSAELGKTEGRERLSAAADNPSQFEIEIHCLEETVADEARDRWKSLTSGFHLEPSTEGVYADAERGVYSRVRELLRCSFDDLILEAWCAHEKRLAAECEGDCCQAPLSATPEADTGPGPVISGLRVPGDHSETLGQKVDRLRPDKTLDDGQRAAVQNTVALGIEAEPTKREVTKQRPDKEQQGDATLLGEKLLVSFKTAEQYLGISERHRQNLVSDQILTVVGKGHNRKITTESLKNCLHPEIPK